MSGKKQKLLRRYLKKRNAIDKKDFNGKRVVSISKEIKNSYNSANKNDKTLLTGFFKGVISSKEGGKK